jgi:arylsulfatase A-like enzyme
MPTGMNFVIYMPDSLRAESIGCYGHPMVRTPSFDRLAREGTTFENCFSQSPFCTPSRCSVVTGWYPHVEGHRSMEYFLRSEQPTLFRYLKDAGYHVEWIGKNDMYDPATDMTRVISRSVGAATYARERIEAGTRKGTLRTSLTCAFGEPGYYNFMQNAPGQEGEFDIAQTGDGRAAITAAQFLRSREARVEPFALFIPGGLPHPPYAVPEPWFGMYDPARAGPLRGVDLEGAPSYRAVYRRYFGWDREDECFFRKMQAVYLGMVSYVDTLFGEILAAIDDGGLSERTAVFAVSDHGDFAGDYGLGHKAAMSVEDVHIRVPFIARVPGMKARHRVREPMELHDLMPTVLALAGIDCKHPHFARSLEPQLAGAAGDPGRAAYCEGGFPAQEAHLWDFCTESLHDPQSVYHPLWLIGREHPETQGTVCVIRTLEHKLVYRRSGECELYDMRNDPREERNLWRDNRYASVRRELTTDLLHWYMETSDVTPFEQQSRKTPPVGNPEELEQYHRAAR